MPNASFPQTLKDQHMTRTLRGEHLIAGTWTASDKTFLSEPAQGEAHRFCAGTTDLVDAACDAAEEAFWVYAQVGRKDRAAFLNAIADEIEARAEDITRIGSAETGLPTARLNGERGRTTGQLRLFAAHILKGDHIDFRHDPAMPDRAPLPRPDLRMVQRPIGPVAVFGASNFPLAFSTAGGDTAAALAAGCPVVVKGHSAHPGTAEIVADAIHAATLSCKMHPGVFSLIQGGNRAVGQALVRHPNIKAVGFTGSLAGGRALFDLCAQRPEPIPFFGELGSVNPMFVLPEAAKARGSQIGSGWAGSLTMGAGQFCTNPGIAVIPRGPKGDAVVAAARAALSDVGPQVMLTDGIAAAYRSGKARFDNSNAVHPVLTTQDAGRHAAPNLYETAAADYLRDADLGEEVFGPLGLVIRVTDAAEMQTLAKGFAGQLTATLHMDDADTDAARALMPILERKAGRVLVNGFPTGVEVADSMVHGGPYPASTNFGATSVGTLSIRRFLRPVCYQDVPMALLPADARRDGHQPPGALCHRRRGGRFGGVRAGRGNRKLSGTNVYPHQAAGRIGGARSVTPRTADRSCIVDRAAGFRRKTGIAVAPHIAGMPDAKIPPLVRPCGAFATGRRRLCGSSVRTTRRALPAPRARPFKFRRQIICKDVEENEKLDDWPHRSPQLTLGETSMTGETNTIFSGTVPALMTPCKADRTPDFDALVAKGRELVDAGMSAVVYCGSMGDWPLLTDAQRMEGVDRLVGAGLRVIVGTGAVNSASAVAHAAHAGKVGAHGLMVIPRVLSRGTSVPAQRAHFKAILAAAPDLPAVIYNSPYYGFATRADLFFDLRREHPNLIGFKEFGGPADMSYAAEYITSKDENVSLMVGVDTAVVHGYVNCGATGAITGIGNVLPAEVLNLVRLSREAAQGNALARQRAQELESALAVLSRFDEGADLVLFFKYMMVLNGDAAYKLHFNETDALSDSQAGFAKAQLGLFRTWYADWSHLPGATA